MPVTGFQPGEHGFAFVNSWQHDDAVKKEVRGLLQISVKTMRKLVTALPGGPVLWLALRDKRDELTTWATEAVVEPYGLCGGMAFAALDYYTAGKDVPRGAQSGIPTKDTPEGRALREYITRRLVDSLVLNGATFLSWMAVLHSSASLGPFRAGPGWLLRQSKRHWASLKRHIDAGRPRPIGLVGTAHDPTLNHQVLAYGYEDTGDGAGKLLLYDMNCPNKEQVIKVDFTGDVLAASEDCRSRSRGELRGFFVEAYLPLPGPPEIAWP